MWIHDESGAVIAFNDDFGGTLASRVDLELSAGPHHLMAEIGGFADIYAGTWTLTAQCIEPIHFFERFLPSPGADGGQCGNSGIWQAIIGDWTPAVRLDT